jgi:hypothetical protein
MNENLGRFVEEIMVLTASHRWFTFDTGDDINQRLQQSTYQFAQALQEPHTSSPVQIQALAREIEGSLLAEETINKLGQPSVDRLIDELHKLTPQ